MGKSDHLIKDSLILFIATSIVNLSNFVYHMYASRKLGPENYGVLVTMLAMFIIVSMPAASLQMTVAKKASEFKAKENWGGIKTLFITTNIWFFVLGAAAFAICYFASNVIKDFFQIKDRIMVVIVGGITIFSMIIPSVRGLLQGMQKFISFGANMVIDAVLRLLALVVMIALGWSARGAIAAGLFSVGSAYIIGFIYLSFIFKYKNDGNTISKMDFFNYTLPVFITMAGFSLLSYMDVFAVKHFYQPYEAGLYSATSIVGKAFLFFPSAIAMALFPKVSAHFALKSDTKKLFYESLLLTAGITLAGVAFCFFFPGFIIKLLFGNQYINIEYIVRIFGIAIFPLVLFNVILNYCLAIHKYSFIYIMYAGIILYGLLLWFLHKSFYQVILNLFISTLLIVVFSIIDINRDKKVQAATIEEELLENKIVKYQ